MLLLLQTSDTFELPERFAESIGTVWKLLKVCVENDGSRWGAYIAAEEASSVSLEDLQNLSANELQDSYDVELTPLESIEAWINASRDLRVAVNLSHNVRRSARLRQPLR